MWYNKAVGERQRLKRSYLLFFKLKNLGNFKSGSVSLTDFLNNN